MLSYTELKNELIQLTNRVIRNEQQQNIDRKRIDKLASMHDDIKLIKYLFSIFLTVFIPLVIALIVKLVA